MICTTLRIDRQCQLGQGEATFQAARDALLRWRMFDLGWIKIADADGPPQVAQEYTILSRLPGIQLSSRCRWRRIWDLPPGDTPGGGARFTLCCQTLSQHPLAGEEYFRVAMHPQTGDVWYTIRSCSRVKPRYRLVAPVIRRYQQRFLLDSFHAMQQASRV